MNIDGSKKFSLTDNIIILLGIVFGFLFMQGFLLILMQTLARRFMSPLINVVTICISLVVSTLGSAYLIMTRIAKCSLTELGLGKLTRNGIIAPLAVISASMTGAWLITRQLEMVLLISLQNAFVAFSEEFVARGCVFYQLRRILKNDWFVFIISTIIFVFIFHSGAPFIENLVWRLPISIVLVIAYSRTKNLILCTSLHFSYNILVSTILQ